MRIVLALLASLIAAPVGAQSWATREVCFVDEPKVYPEAFAPATYADVQEIATTIPNGTGRYWRVTSPGGAVSHLWGTIHSNDPMMLGLPERVEADIEAARLVATETNYVFASREEYHDYILSEYMYSDTEASEFDALDLPPRLNHWIRTRFEGLGWQYDGPDLLKPAAVAEILLGDPCSDFASGTYPIQDDRIQMLGEIAGAEVLSLEHPDAFFDKLNAPENRDLTKAIIATYGAYLDPQKMQEETATVYALYLQGRLAEWMASERLYLDAVFPGGQGLRWLEQTDAYLLEERNLDFLQKALPALDQGGVFMAVGCFHLPGETGLIALLRDEGYRVERILLPGEAPA